MKQYIFGIAIGAIIWSLFLFFFNTLGEPTSNLSKDYIITYENVSPNNQWSLAEFRDAENDFHLHPGTSKPTIINFIFNNSRTVVIKFQLMPINDHVRNEHETVIVSLKKNGSTFFNKEIFENNLYQQEVEMKSKDTLSFVLDKGKNDGYDHTQLILDTEEKKLVKFYRYFLALIISCLIGISLSITVKIVLNKLKN